MKTIEDMKLELLSDNSNKFMQTLIDYDIKSKDKYGSNLLHYYIMNSLLSRKSGQVGL